MEESWEFAALAGGGVLVLLESAMVGGIVGLDEEVEVAVSGLGIGDQY